MSENIKTPAYYVKTILIAALLYIETTYLTKSLINYVYAQDFFSVNVSFAITTVIALTLISTTIALHIGCWNKWEQYVFTPLPISAAIFISIFPTNSTYAILAAAIVYLLLCYEIFLASELKKKLITFNPGLILRFISKGVVLSFSIVASIILIVMSPQKPEVDIGTIVGDYAEKALLPKLDLELEKNIYNELSNDEIDHLGAVGLDPAQFGLNSNNFLNNIGVKMPSLSIKDRVKTEVDRVTEPYKKLLNPLMAVMVFSIIQFLGFFSRVIFSIIILPMFWIAYSTGLLKKSTITVEKEELHF